MWRWLLPLGLAGCVLGDVNLDGRGCPCVAGFQCVDDRCVPEGVDAGTDDAGPEDAGLLPCAADRDCSEPLVCEGGLCQPPCGERTCDDPSACDEASGHCLVLGPCASDGECSPPRALCVGGRCEPGCGLRDAPCRLDRVCDLGSGHCQPSPACSSDDGCPAGFWCDGASCRQRCTEPGAPPCRGGTCEAESGRCSGLELGEACDSDAACASGDCFGVRIVRDGQEQVFRFCGRPCGATADCPLGSDCVPVSGSGQCVPSRVLAGTNPRDQRSGAACEPTVPSCQSGYCEALTCAEGCARDRDCAGFSGTACISVFVGSGPVRPLLPRCLEPFVGAAAGEACQANGDCAGALCVNQRCAKLCCAPRDCADGQVCLRQTVGASSVGVCEAAPPSGRALGAACADPSECSSGVCGPADANNPLGARFCTTLCCTDPDCDGLPFTGPSGGRCATAPDSEMAAILPGRCVRSGD